MCKRSNTFSLAVLIGRGLDHNFLVKIARRFLHESAFALFSFQGIHPFTYTALNRVRYFSVCGELFIRLRRLLTGFFFSVEKTLLFTHLCYT